MKTQKDTQKIRTVPCSSIAAGNSIIRFSREQLHLHSPQPTESQTGTEHHRECTNQVLPPPPLPGGGGAYHRQQGRYFAVDRVRILWARILLQRARHKWRRAQKILLQRTTGKSCIGELASMALCDIHIVGCGEHLPAWGLRDDRILGTDHAVRGGRRGQQLHSGFPSRQVDVHGSADARSSADDCLSR